tara:strand:- start:124 stop:588 length:465 start_codon:yes stop_codon:yes gene_type:complete
MLTNTPQDFYKNENFLLFAQIERIQYAMQMTATEFRKHHLLQAIAECKSIESLSKKTDLAPQYISQLKSGVRGIGNKTARKIESAMEWKSGCMDVPPLDDEAVGRDFTSMLGEVTEDQLLAAIVEAIPRLSDADANRLLVQLLLNQIEKPGGGS